MAQPGAQAMTAEAGSNAEYRALQHSALPGSAGLSPPLRRIDPACIHFAASDSPRAREAMAQLVARYGNADPQGAQVVVALGGDGFMLQTLHQRCDGGTPIYGMNFGSLGFLMNPFAEDALVERLERAEATTVHPLRMIAHTEAGSHEALAINEVSLLRETAQAAKLRILVDQRERMAELVCDGILLATPAGSTAYNLSAHGPILPLDSGVLALTPLSPFRPRRWRGAILSHRAAVRIEVLEAAKRPVSAVADSFEVRNVIAVDVAEDRDVGLTMLFEAGRNLEERLLREQFET